MFTASLVQIRYIAAPAMQHPHSLQLCTLLSFAPRPLPLRTPAPCNSSTVRIQSTATSHACLLECCIPARGLSVSQSLAILDLEFPDLEVMNEGVMSDQGFSSWDYQQIVCMQEMRHDMLENDERG